MPGMQKLSTKSLNTENEKPARIVSVFGTVEEADRKVKEVVERRSREMELTRFRAD